MLAKRVHQFICWVRRECTSKLGCANLVHHKFTTKVGSAAFFFGVTDFYFCSKNLMYKFCKFAFFLKKINVFLLFFDVTIWTFFKIARKIAKIGPTFGAIDQDNSLSHQTLPYLMYTAGPLSKYAAIKIPTRGWMLTKFWGAADLSKIKNIIFLQPSRNVTKNARR